MITLEWHSGEIYHFTGLFSDDGFVRLVANAPHHFETIRLHDSGDCGMTYFGGDYTVEAYFALSSKMYLDIDYIYVRFPQDGVSMIAKDYDNTVDVITNRPDFDLDRFFGITD